MSEEREPIRLRDDPSEEPAFRALFDAAAGEHADDAMLERVLASVLASGGGGGGGGTPPAKALPTAAIAAGGALAVVAVGLLATLAWPAAPSPRVTPAPDASIHDTLVVPDTLDAVPDTLDAVPDTSDAVPDTNPARTSTPEPQRPPHTTAPASEATTGEADFPLLRHARAERDPSRSLALALEHRERFPSSPLAEDRDALIVEDLAALGRTADARRAAQAFRARYPSSAHLSRMQSLLDGL